MIQKRCNQLFRIKTWYIQIIGFARVLLTPHCRFLPIRVPSFNPSAFSFANFCVFTCFLAPVSVSLSNRFYVPSRLSKRSVYPLVFTFPLTPLRGSVPSRFSKKFGQCIHLSLHALSFRIVKGSVSLSICF